MGTCKLFKIPKLRNAKERILVSEIIPKTAVIPSTSTSSPSTSVVKMSIPKTINTTTTKLPTNWLEVDPRDTGGTLLAWTQSAEAQAMLREKETGIKSTTVPPFQGKFSGHKRKASSRRPFDDLLIFSDTDHEIEEPSDLLRPFTKQPPDQVKDDYDPSKPINKEELLAMFKELQEEGKKNPTATPLPNFRGHAPGPGVDEVDNALEVEFDETGNKKEKSKYADVEIETEIWPTSGERKSGTLGRGFGALPDLFELHRNHVDTGECFILLVLALATFMPVLLGHKVFQSFPKSLRRLHGPLLQM